MSIVSTGQITIVDQNDAKPITALISASQSLQQVYSKNNGIGAFFPNWVSTPITLTANVYVGGVNVGAGSSCSNRVWSTTFDGAQIGTNSVTFTRNTNLTTAAPSLTLFFRCTYIDPVTLIQSRVDAQVSLTLVQTGSNAVYVLLSGGDAIKKVASGTPERTAVKADLVRSSGFDTDNLQYRWYSINSAGVRTKLHSAVAGVANYAVASTASGAVPVATGPTLGASTFTTAGITTATVGTPDADWCTAGNPGFNTLIISEGAVNNVQMFQVEVRDTAEGAVADRPVYTAYFTITDTSDPISLEVLSNNGDRLLNGQGSTRLSVKVYSGQTEISSYTGWSFNWYLQNKDGQRVGFVALPAAPSATPTSMRTITSNTTGGLVISASESYAANELVKLVSADGALIKFAEVTASTSSTTVTLKAPSGGNINCGAVASLNAGEFNGGLIYKAVAMKTTSNEKLGPVITQHDVDGKNTVTVDAEKS